MVGAWAAEFRPELAGAFSAMKHEDWDIRTLRGLSPGGACWGKVLARQAQGTTTAFMSEPKELVIEVLSRWKAPWAALLSVPISP